MLISFFSAVLISMSFRPILDFHPPGTVEVVDNFFYDQNEVSNINWKVYKYMIGTEFGEDSEEYKSTLLDTEVWLELDGHMGPLVNVYDSHPSYDDYPVVGVSHDQAKSFCEWRTKAIRKNLKENDIEAPSFEYRLPSLLEWKLIADLGFSDKTKKKIEKMKKRNTRKNQFSEPLLYNMKSRKIESENPNIKDNYRSTLPAPSFTYLPNEVGVFNIYGNIAEMVREPGIAVGGSFMHYYDDIVPSNKTIEYSGPRNWLGFRCVCETNI